MTHDSIVGNGRILDGPEASLCPREDMRQFRRRGFDTTVTLPETCHANASFDPSATMGQAGRPTGMSLTLSDHRRRLENWQIDRQALNGG